MNIKKNDTVKIIRGKDRGKTGKVLGVFPKENKVLVENINMLKNYIRPKRQGEKGQIVSTARPLDASKVMLVCGACQRAVRINKGQAGDRSVRLCKRCKSKI